jgi:hypothetical protein
MPTFEALFGIAIESFNTQAELDQVYYAINHLLLLISSDLLRVLFQR